MSYRRYRTRPRLRRLAALTALVCAGFVAATAAAQSDEPGPTETAATTQTETTTTTAPTTTEPAVTETTESEPEPELEPALIADSVTVAGVPVGGMTRAEAVVAVRASFVRPLALRLGVRTFLITPSRVGAHPLLGVAVDSALAAAPGEAVALPILVNGWMLRVWATGFERNYSKRVINSRVYLRGLRPFITGARPGIDILRLALMNAVRREVLAHERGPVAVPRRIIRPRLTRTNFGPIIVIRRGSKRLVLYSGMRYWRIFPVATGQASYPTPLGRFTIVTKQRNPWWFPPNSDWARGAKPIPPGPGNPLGTRWMGLSRGGVGIHGTPDAASVGYSASHGCIRMYIPHAEWVFEHVRIGTTVFIVSA
jgi:hypothetical protein